MREWTAPARSRLSPALRRGPVLRDATTRRPPLPADIRAIWSWCRRASPSTWAQDTVVASTVDATLPDDPALVSDGWLQATLLPDNTYHDEAIPVRVTFVRSTGRPGRSRRILALGGTNADGSQFLIAVQDAVLMIDSRVASPSTWRSHRTRGSGCASCAGEGARPTCGPRPAPGRRTTWPTWTTWTTSRRLHRIDRTDRRRYPAT